MNNELIQRLALEAGFSGPSDSSVDSDDPDRNNVTVRSEYGVGVELARFAALVAEECAKICDERRHDTAVLTSLPLQSAAAYGAAQKTRATFKRR